MSSCVVFSQSLSFSLPLTSPVAGELGCCHEALFLCRLINMFLFFSLSEEKTQLVLNVDKQLEEVRELVRLWSVIFSSSHFLNNEFVERGRGQFSLAPDNSTCIILVVTWHADTHRHTHSRTHTSHGGKEASSSHDYFPVICFKVTPLWHISSHYLQVGVFMLLFKNEQSHLTETNCCCSCLVMSQWLVSSKSATERPV